MRLRDLIISNEEIDSTNTPVVEEGIVVEDPVTEIEESNSEIQSDVVELERDDETLNELNEDSEELNAVSDSLTEALEDPNYQGMDQVGIEMLAIRLNKFSTKYGIKLPECTKDISAESFLPESTSRREATQIALEAVEETKKGFWAKVWAGIEYAWDAIVNFAKRWFTKTGRINAALKKLVSQLKNSKGELKTKTGEANVTMQKCLVSENVNFSEFTKMLDRQKAANISSLTSIDYLNDAVMSIKIVFDKDVNNGNTHSGAKDKGSTPDWYKELFKKLDLAVMTKLSLGTNKEPLAFGNYYEALTPAISKPGSNDFADHVFQIRKQTVNFKPNKDSKVEYADINEMQKLVANCISTMEGIKKIEDLINKGNKEVKGLMKMLKSDKFFDAINLIAMFVKRAINNVIGLIRKLNSIVIGDTMSVISNSIKFVQLSIKAHDGLTNVEINTDDIPTNNTNVAGYLN